MHRYATWKWQKNEIDIARENGDSLGGIFEIIAVGVPTGLGSCMHYDRKLDVRICSSLMSIQSIKGVEFGLGFNYSGIKGSECHDEIFYDKNKIYWKKTNNCGGIEGWMSNG